ncbi:MAG: O-antigen ligase family protein [Luteimonas sp.]
MSPLITGRPSRTRGLARLLALVFVVTFLTGGGSQDRGVGDAIAQLLALPLLAWSIWTLRCQPLSGLRRLAIAIAVLIAVIPVLQLLPLPTLLWRSNAARLALEHDLSLAGVGLASTWSLVPAATERAALALLPALSVFFAALAIAPHERTRMMWLFLGMAVFSLLLGLVQLGQPQDSLLNPFPQWAPAFGGVFANPNHQATALACAAICALALLLAGNRSEADRDSRQLAGRWLLGACFAMCTLALPLTGSRAGVLFGILGLAMVPVAMGTFRPARLRASASARWGLALMLCGAVFGVWVSLQWLRVDAVAGLRWPLAKATVALGNAYAPWGAGVGAFVPLFAQEGPTWLLQYEYINHAHNEYAQWWLEAGIPAMLALAGVLAVLGLVLRKILHYGSHGRSRAIAAGSWLGIIVLLAHSIVDYPMRTAALMTVAALLAANAISPSR